MEDCLRAHASAVDLSLMGRGKSYVACALATVLKLNLVVFCPNNTKSNWKTVWNLFRFGEKSLAPKKVRRKRAVDPKEDGPLLKRPRKSASAPTLGERESVRSSSRRTMRKEQNSLCSKGGSNLKNDVDGVDGGGRDNDDDGEDEPVFLRQRASAMNYERLSVGGYGRVLRDGSRSYRASPEWTTEVAEGVLMVLDEAHFLKNDGRLRTSAALTLVEEVYAQWRAGGRSRVVLLTGTPMDDVENQSPLWARLMGMYRSPISRQDALLGRVVEGFDEFLRSAGFEDAERAEEVHAALTGLSNPQSRLCQILLTRVAKKRFFAMPSPALPTRFDVANEFCWLSSNAAEIVAKGVHRLRCALAALASVDRNDPVALGRAFNGVRAALVAIERGKQEIMVRKTREILNRDPRSKVVLAFNSVDVIKSSAEELRSLKPMIFYGRTTVPERERILRDFQSQSLEHRVLVCNQTMCATGIPLHDLHGDRPRTLLAIPTYQLLNMHQLSYRVHRIGSKSDATVRWIYAQGEGLVEHELLRSISRKCQDLQKCFGFCARSDAEGSAKETPFSEIVLPDAYPSLHETPPSTQSTWLSRRA